MKGKKGFQKGEPKKGGKQKGSKNRKTIEWEEFGRELLEFGLPRAMNIMKNSTDRNFMFYFGDLIEYFKPKLSRAENNNNDTLTIEWKESKVYPKK